MKKLLIYSLAWTLISGCAKKEVEKKDTMVKTPVEVTPVKQASFVLSKTFKGVTHYLTSGDIKSPITGYITKVYISIGDQIKKGTPLYGLETKEAYVLRGKNYLNDPILKNIGHTTIYASDGGLIILVNGEEKEYVQEGTLLARFAAPDMFVFLIEVPAEQDSSVVIGKICKISLPNGTIIDGKISSSLAVADSGSQTETFVIVPLKKMILPAGLQLKITFIDYEKNHAQSLPKEAVLSNEIQTDFWVMKLINDTTAVKVPVKMGLQNDTEIEIIEPVFSKKDRIISKGNYGLSDTAFVEVKTMQNGK